MEADHQPQNPINTPTIKIAQQDQRQSQKELRDDFKNYFEFTETLEYEQAVQIKQHRQRFEKFHIESLQNTQRLFQQFQQKLAQLTTTKTIIPTESNINQNNKEDNEKSKEKVEGGGIVSQIKKMFGWAANSSALSPTPSQQPQQEMSLLNSTDEAYKKYV